MNKNPIKWSPSLKVSLPFGGLAVIFDKPLGLQSGKQFVRLPPPKMQPFHGLGHRQPILLS